jgi:hypothetical protein
MEPYNMIISKKGNFMTLMKAVQVSSPRADFELVSKEIPEPKENEVLIKVEACGICQLTIILIIMMPIIFKILIRCV